MSIWDYDRWGGMLSLREAMNWLLEESFVAGALARSLTLPLEVQFSRVDATFENGVLTLTLPKAERLRPKTTKINVGGGATAIRAQAGASRSARDDERAEVAPTTDEASAESTRTQQTTDEASAESRRTQQTTATRQTGGAAGPSDETADLPGDASGAS
jgi:Hsp20/alpha crystallin family